MARKKTICFLILLGIFGGCTKERPFGFKPLYIEGSADSHFENDSLVSIFPPRMYGNKKSGYSFESKIAPGLMKSISFEVMFPEDFDFVRGGKLPGLCSNSHVSGGKRATGKNGFSARVVWRKDGAAVVYVYHVGQAGKYGDIFPWADSSNTPVVFKRGAWQTIQMMVKVNDIGKSNGLIKTYLNHQLVFNKNDFVFRTRDGVQIDRLCFNTFFGGDDDSWAPSKQEKLYIRNMKVD